MIYLCGSPALAIFNFGNGVLNAVGDTKRPLMYLMTAGIVNIILNLFFVIVCKMGVSGVALASIIAQYLSAFLIIRCLIVTKQSYRLSFHRSALIRRLPLGFYASEYRQQCSTPLCGCQYMYTDFDKPVQPCCSRGKFGSNECG